MFVEKSQNAVKNPLSANSLQEAPPFSKNLKHPKPRPDLSALFTNNMKKDHGQPFPPKRPVGTRRAADFRQKRSWIMVPSSHAQSANNKRAFCVTLSGGTIS